MLEFYKKHYVAKNIFINLLDVVLAIVVTLIVYRDWAKNELQGVTIFLLVVVWIKAILTTYCIIRYRNEKEVEG